MKTIKEKLKVYLGDFQQGLDQEKTAREIKKRMQKAYRAFDRLPERTNYDFYCMACAIEFDAPAYKSWNEATATGSWISFCPICGNHVARHITDRTTDPYYEMSAKIRQDRSQFEADMLRPEQYGFKTLYPDAYDRYFDSVAERQDANRELYASVGLADTPDELTKDEDVARMLESDDFGA